MSNVSKEDLNERIKNCHDENELIQLIRQFDSLERKDDDQKQENLNDCCLLLDDEEEEEQEEQEEEDDDDDQTTLIECLICYDEQVSDWHRLQCGHIYCKRCLGEMCRALMQTAAGIDDMRCPNPECLTMLDYGDVCAIADDETLIRFEQFSFSRGLAPYEVNRVVSWCPTPGCNTALAPRFDEPTLLECDRCGRTACTQCRQRSHEGSTCEQFAEWSRHNDVHHSEADGWIRWNTKPCPNCQTPIFKDGGCTHVVCYHCGHSFDWTLAGTPLQRALGVAMYGSLYFVGVPIVVAVTAQFSLPIIMCFGAGYVASAILDKLNN